MRTQLSLDFSCRRQAICFMKENPLLIMATILLLKKWISGESFESGWKGSNKSTNHRRVRDHSVKKLLIFNDYFADLDNGIPHMDVGVIIEIERTAFGDRVKEINL